MTIKRRSTFAAVCLAVLLAQNAWAESPRTKAPAPSNKGNVLCSAAAALEAQTIAIAPQCVASTVGLVITVQSENAAKMATGSGVVVSADGLILTVGHVVEKPGTRLTVRFADGRVVQGVSLGLDHQADTGMVRITDPAPEGGWPFSPPAPADAVRGGQWVLAVGHPGSIVIGRDPPLRLGRVTGRDEAFIQTNCAIEPGDSGGPLFDLTGRVIGVNSSIQATGLGKDRIKTWRTHHVPIELFAAQWKDLVAGKEFNPEKKGDADEHEVTSDDIAQLQEAIMKLAGQNDSEAQKILEEAKANGGRLHLSEEQVAKLFKKAGITPRGGAAPKTKGVPEDLRPFFRPGLKRALLQQMPNAKVPDALLERILDRSVLDVASAKFSPVFEPEDFEAMGFSQEAVAELTGDAEQSTRLAKQFDKSSLQTTAMFAPALDAAGNCVVEVCSDGKPILLGTVVDADGWIVTKASDLCERPTVVLADGSEAEAEVVGKDAATDLALLKVKAEGLTAALFSSAPPLGAWLASPVRDPNQPAVGTVSITARPIPELFSHFHGNQKVILGLSVTGDSCEVGELTPGMPAEAAGVKVGDKILELNGQPVQDATTLVSKVLQGKAGETLTLKVRRQGKVLEFKAVLGETKSIIHTENGIGEEDDIAAGKLSKRRTNFPLAIQHDAFVWADQCGGPLVNLEGKTVGINIARYDQVCTFALPAEIVQKTVAKLRGERP